MQSSFVALFLAVVPVGALQAQQSHDQHAMLSMSKEDSPCRPGSIWWMHVVKNGEAFSHAINNSPCKSKVLLSYGHLNGHAGEFHTQGPGHIPLPPNVNDEDLGHVVALFRKSDQRLASSFGHLSRHAVSGTTGFAGWGFPSKEEMFRVHELAEKGKTPGNDDSLRKYAGCQTNMINGRGCMTGVVNDPNDISEALARVDKFLLAGIQEEWELSVCLFNFKVSGKRFINNIQMGHSHRNPMKKDTSPALTKTSSRYDTSGYPQNDPDEKLYKHVEERFMKDLKEYNINRETCGREENGNPYIFQDYD